MFLAISVNAKPITSKGSPKGLRVSSNISLETVCFPDLVSIGSGLGAVLRTSGWETPKRSAFGLVGCSGCTGPAKPAPDGFGNVGGNKSSVRQASGWLSSTVQTWTSVCESWSGTAGSCSL